MVKTFRSALAEVVCWSLFVAALAVPVASADGPAKPPALTSEQRKDVMLAAKDFEVAQLRAQLVMAEFERARAAFEKAKADVTPAGFVLTEKLELVPVPAKEPAK